MSSEPLPDPSDLPGPAALARTIAQAAVPRHELALQEPQVRRFVNLSVSREDKEAADTVQAWYGFQVGRRVPHWELYNLVLAEALQNERGRFYRMTAKSWV